MRAFAAGEPFFNRPFGAARLVVLRFAVVFLRLVAGFALRFRVAGLAAGTDPIIAATACVTCPCASIGVSFITSALRWFCLLPFHAPCVLSIRHRFLPAQDRRDALRVPFASLPGRTVSLVDR